MLIHILGPHEIVERTRKDPSKPLQAPAGLGAEITLRKVRANGCVKNRVHFLRALGEVGWMDCGTCTAGPRMVCSPKCRPAWVIRWQEYLVDHPVQKIHVNLQGILRMQVSEFRDLFRNFGCTSPHHLYPTQDGVHVGPSSEAQRDVEQSAGSTGLQENNICLGFRDKGLGLI